MDSFLAFNERFAKIRCIFPILMNTFELVGLSLRQASPGQRSFLHHLPTDMIGM